MDFLDEYIHLEKLCNDIYRTNHGISKYIEDLESASYATIRKIPSWESTYKKLKELRWKRNKYVHEGNVEFDDEDTEWLTSFYQKIISGNDPLSLKRALEDELVRKKNPNIGHMRNDNTTNPVQQKGPSIGLGWCVAVIVIIVLIGVIVAMSFL